MDTATTTITTITDLMAQPVGTMIRAEWDQSSPSAQPPHHIIRTGSAQSGAGAGGFTLAREDEWAALINWGATLTVVSTPTVTISPRV